MEYDYKIVDLGEYQERIRYGKPIQTGTFPRRKKVDIENKIKEIQERNNKKFSVKYLKSMEIEVLKKIEDK